MMVKKIANILFSKSLEILTAKNEPKNAPNNPAPIKTVSKFVLICLFFICIINAEIDEGRKYSKLIPCAVFAQSPLILLKLVLAMYHHPYPYHSLSLI